MKIIIDTNAYAELAKGNTHILALMQTADQIVVSTIVMGELYAGFRLGAKRLQNVRRLDEFLKTPGVVTVAPDSSIAERYGELIGLLKENGTPIPTNDVWIAATAFETAARVLTFDSHYRAVPGLMTVL